MPTNEPILVKSYRKFESSHSNNDSKRSHNEPKKTCPNISNEDVWSLPEGSWKVHLTKADAGGEELEKGVSATTEGVVWKEVVAVDVVVVVIVVNNQEWLRRWPPLLGGRRVRRGIGVVVGEDLHRAPVRHGVAFPTPRPKFESFCPLGLGLGPSSQPFIPQNKSKK